MIHCNIIRVVILLLALVVCGCGGSGDPSTGDLRSVNSGQAASTGIRGQVFTQGNQFILARDEVRAQQVPAANATVSIVGTSFSTTTDDHGVFQLTGIVPGAGRLRVTMGGQTQEFPFFAIPRAIVSFEPLTLDAEAALAQARRTVDILGPQFRENTDQLVLMGLPHPVPSGVTLSERLNASDVPRSRVLDADTWLFFLDPAFEVGYEKKTAFLLVDATTGSTELWTCRSYPDLNGARLFATNNLSSDFLVSGPSASPETSRRAPERGASPVLAQSAGEAETFGLIIAGEADDATIANVDRIKDNFADFGLPPLVNGEFFEYNTAVAELPRPVEDVTAIFNFVVNAAGPEDTVFLYFTGHGENQGLYLEDRLGDNVQRRALSWHNLSFASCRSCRVVIICESCFSGTACLDGEGSRFPGLDVPGRQFIILSSAQRRGPNDGNSTALPFPFPQAGLGTGSVYTQLLVDNLFEADGTPLIMLDVAHETTREQMDNFSVLGLTFQDVVKRIRAQRARSFLDLDPPHTCDELEPFLPPPPEEIEVELALGVDEQCLKEDEVCPKVLGTYTVTNTGEHRTGVVVSNPLHYVEARIVTPPPISSSSTVADLEPGQSLTVEVVLVDCDFTDFEGRLMDAIDVRIENILTTLDDTRVEPVDLNFEICPKEDGDGDGDGGIPIEPVDFDFTHTVGTTPCPQSLGPVTIGNDTEGPVNWMVSATPPVRVVGSTSGTVTAGEQVQVPLEFDCSTTQGFQSSVTVTTTPQGGASRTTTLPVRGTINN